MGPRKGAARQGIYVTVADGSQLLGFKHNDTPPDKVLEMLYQAAETFKGLPEDKRKPGAIQVEEFGQPDPKLSRRLPANGLILDVYTRMIDRDSKGELCALQGAVQLDVTVPVPALTTIAGSPSLNGSRSCPPTPRRAQPTRCPRAWPSACCVSTWSTIRVASRCPGRRRKSARASWTSSGIRRHIFDRVIDYILERSILSPNRAVLWNASEAFDDIRNPSDHCVAVMQGSIALSSLRIGLARGLGCLLSGQWRGGRKGGGRRKSFSGRFHGRLAWESFPRSRGNH